jgi:oligopeptidase B
VDGPPVAARRPVVRSHHGRDRVDDYAWLGERTAEVLDLLRAENAWTESATAHLRPVREELLREYHARVQETDQTAPLRTGAWWYLTRTGEGRSYPILCRRRERDGEDEVVLDVNVVASEHNADYLAVETEVSRDGRLLAYAIDRDGSENFEIHFRDLEAGTDLLDVVGSASYGMAWADAGAALWYVRADASMRPYQAWIHRLGTPAADDVCVFEEPDARFELALELSRSGDLVVLHLESKMSTEVWIVDAWRGSAPRLVERRRQGVEYHVCHQGSRLLIVTNADGATDFKVVEAPVATPGSPHWRELVPHRPGTKVEDVVAFAHHAVRLERSDGLLRVVVMDEGGDSFVIHEPDPSYALDLDDEADYDAGVARYRFSSPVRPTESVDLVLAEGRREVVKRETVRGGWDPDAFETHRLVVEGDVPLTIVHRRAIALDGTHPVLLYGYGSYSHSIDPGWSALRVSLLERGVIWAVAHVRGGGERGRRWYEEGRLAAKPATFADFVACATHLVDAGYTSPGRIAIRGASAGGLLVGAVTNMRPELWAAVVAEVPFVDALNTILDPSLPMTVTEWEEWGNPVVDESIYDVMASYSPYDNVRDAPYPAVLATSGLNDPRVGFWEPAKWVQRLRRHTTSGRPVLLRTEMGAGHGGPSGRYDAWADEAFVQAFVIEQLGAVRAAAGSC